LANINLSAQILLNKKEFDENQIKQIESESSKLSQLVDTLLQMSILSKFQNKDKLNIKKEIENIIEKYKNKLEEKNITLKMELQNISKEINKNQFEILVNNLISNAIKYNKER
jgi:signal transduction histidine kinase